MPPRKKQLTEGEEGVTAPEQPEQPEVNSAVSPPPAPVSHTGIDVNTLHAQLANQQELINQLMAGYIATKNQADQRTADEEGFPVVSTSQYAVGFTVFDERLRMERSYYLRRSGERVFLSRNQILELKRRFPALFRSGRISAPDFIPDNANVVPDPLAFVKKLTTESAAQEIERINSKPTLYALWNEVESMRFEPGVDKDGKPVLNQVELEPKYLLIQALLQRRLEALGSSMQMSQTSVG